MQGKPEQSQDNLQQPCMCITAVFTRTSRPTNKNGEKQKKLKPYSI